MSPELSHSELAHALRSLPLGVTASDLHGSLTGYLCAGADAGPDDWLDALELGFGESGLAGNAALRRLHDACRAQVAQVPADIDPLLPAPGAGLPQRAAGPVEWCRGFLGGFGLGAAHGAPLSAEANEILADFGTIAATRFDYSGTAGEARALADVIDFVRSAGAMLCRQMRTHAAAGARSLH